MSYFRKLIILRSSNELARLDHPVHVLQPARTAPKTEKVMDETISEKLNMFNHQVSVLADYSIRVACENNSFENQRFSCSRVRALVAKRSLFWYGRYDRDKQTAKIHDASLKAS